ncbi:5-(carboxyamino)imidazole ribonucleotide mutase [Dehalogenimonas etheniformans]|uniref:N5-carboxyaminoimidazole ribonucleotide mutase n=1 Tax=Dehalogenimonas etheniformans TaxID=1536648 RepID=A0A2P5P683_9CHLR|nr:5-(carboxyamino)imidazole ribonucleotide mutase [Dehalogenimonas etheniformans]PPD57790.1 5-(carboxyamino)imidazole ribonucleotide mutase [Dehalogenimonas etheniformans]QNT76132.1 5-(carboxyamino)imidazole ribonucleotide mutase [Dehalogenimonas etheniformans]
MPKVAVVMGSKSDLEVMQAAVDALAKMGLESEVMVMSAHRQPEKVHTFCTSARDKGFEVIIAGAGAAAHLPGVIASWTTLPVIGVPIPSSDLKGIDSLYAIVQMPAGVPVATVAIGTAGAKNAGYLAAQILGLKYPEVARAYENLRTEFKGN